MPTIVLSPKDFGAEIRKRLAADTEVVRLAALEATLWGERRAVQITNEVGAVDQGLFKQSWTTYQPTSGALGGVFATATERAAELRNDAPYAGIIEHGRRPGRPGPPLAPIVGWVKRKLGGEIRGQYRFAKRLSLGLAGTKGTRKARAKARKEVREAFDTEKIGVGTRVLYVAMQIQRSIHVRGTKPRRILFRTFEEMKPRFKAEAIRRLRSNRRR